MLITAEDVDKSSFCRPDKTDAVGDEVQLYCFFGKQGCQVHQTEVPYLPFPFLLKEATDALHL